jgi:hypothetical protein
MEIPSWHTIPQCLWSSATRIPGKVTLNTDYEEIRDFFLNILSIPEMTLQVVYDKLKNDDLDFSVEEVKIDLLEFSSLLTSDNSKLDPRPVLRNRIFPVKSPNGVIKLQDGSRGFAIVDRINLRTDFAKKAKYLDFNLNEVRRIQPFIQWAGLEDRYLSTGVKEIFYAETTSTRPISSPDRDIKRKAHALLR